MPITQDRMIKLIECAQEWVDYANFIRARIEEAHQYEQDNAAIQALWMSVRTMDKPEWSLIEIEKRHFQRMGKRNQYEKERQTHFRRGFNRFTSEGIVPLKDYPPQTPTEQKILDRAVQIKQFKDAKKFARHRPSYIATPPAVPNPNKTEFDLGDRVVKFSAENSYTPDQFMQGFFGPSGLDEPPTAEPPVASPATKIVLPPGPLTPPPIEELALQMAKDLGMPYAEALADLKRTKP